MVIFYVWFRQLYHRTALFALEGQAIFAYACTRIPLRYMGVYMGIQLWYAS